MSSSPPAPRRGRTTRRVLSVASILGLTVGGLLVSARPAHGQLPDAIPTWWHEAAGLTPLLTAPPPPNPATICLIDTGVTPTPDLDITARWAYDGGTLDDVHATEDNPGHGTLVAHFAAGAVNGWGGAGAFPHARISSVRVFPKEGGARWQDYIRAITRCLKLDPMTKVILISIGGEQIGDGEADELEAHIEQARNLYGVSVVAAAGNGGGATEFPGRFAAAFTVTASDQVHELCDFAARGPGVDIAAPGCRLPQAGWAGEQWSVAGTSFAAPIVAGALAALRSYTDLSSLEAEEVLVGDARSGLPSRLNMEAVWRALGLEVADMPPAPSARLPPASLPASLGQTPSPLASPTAPRLPRPRVAVRRTHRTVVLTISNRPAGSSLELRLHRRRLLRRSSRVRLRSRHSSARCRFVDETAFSPWIRVRW